MAEIRNLTRNGETFYPLTTSSAVINEATGEGLVIDEVPTSGSNNLVKSGGVYNFKDILSRYSENNGIDLCFVDEKMNCLFIFKNGEIITKNFNSENAVVSFEDLDKDLILQDVNRNSLMVINGGHVQTKYFDSIKENPWGGKSICIIGDSIVEQGYFIDALKKELCCTIYNRGWSGSMVTPTVARGTAQNSQAYAFVHRFDTNIFPENNDVGSGYQTSICRSGMPSADKVDLMIIFGGTNDWGHGHEQGQAGGSERTRIAMGEITDAMSDVLVDPNSANVGASFAAALKYTCYQAKQKYPNIPLALCTLLPSFGYNVSGTDEISASNRSSEYVVNADMSCILQEKQFLDGMKTKEDINNIIRMVAKQFGAYVIDLDKMLGFPDFTQAFANKYYNSGDMTHPSWDFGAPILGKFIAKQIRDNIVFINK